MLNRILRRRKAGSHARIGYCFGRTPTITRRLSVQSFLSLGRNRCYVITIFSRTASRNNKDSNPRKSRPTIHHKRRRHSTQTASPLHNHHPHHLSGSLLCPNTTPATHPATDQHRTAPQGSAAGRTTPYQQSHPPSPPKNRYHNASTSES